MSSPLLLATVLAAVASPRLATLPLPGDVRFATEARSVFDVLFTMDPSVPAGAGLFDDAERVPSYAPASVEALLKRLDASLAAMGALPWREWPVDRQVDFRWVYANAEAARQQLAVERSFTHRPAAWLEPYSNALIALTAYAPDAAARRGRLWKRLPQMLREIREVCTSPTRRDLETARSVVTALEAMAERDRASDAKAALAQFGRGLDALKPEKDATVVGEAAYAWRLQRALLLPWSPAQLLSEAESELARVDARIAELRAKLPPAPEATPVWQHTALTMDRAEFLTMHDEITESLRKATLDGQFVTIPKGVGPLRARETPEAMVPLTGDGGSMNPPPPFVPFDVGYWNVEHYSAKWTPAQRLEYVVALRRFRENGMGPYAAHEGIPGHHLQLAIARLNKNPFRNLLQDPVLTEGWALYAEQVLWEHGGFGKTMESEHSVLRSYRHRIARVVFDVKLETGKWSLQEAADFKYRAAPGKGKVDPDLLRAIQWPTQLISYYAGKRQLLALKEEYRKKVGAKYSERAFHDAVLAEGSIPITLIRAKLLGEAVPDLEAVAVQTP